MGIAFGTGCSRGFGGAAKEQRSWPAGHRRRPMRRVAGSMDTPLPRFARQGGAVSPIGPCAPRRRGLLVIRPDAGKGRDGVELSAGFRV